MPEFVRVHHPPPPLGVRFPADGATFTDDGDRNFVRRLVLVETVTAEHIAMSRQHMHRIFNSHARKHPVSRIRDKSLDRANQPFSRIQNMRQRVLNRSTSRCVIYVIRVAIRRTVGGKILTTDGYNLDGLSEPTAQHGFSHRRQRRITSQDIGHSHHETTLADHACQLVGSVGACAERLFDQQMDAGVSQSYGNLQMSIRGRCNDGCCDSPGRLIRHIGTTGQSRFKIGETANVIALGDGGTEYVIDLNE